MRMEKANGRYDGADLPRSNVESLTVKNITPKKNVIPKDSGPKRVVNIGKTRKSSTPAAQGTTSEIKSESMLNGGLESLSERLPVLFGNSNLNSPEGKLAQLNLLDDTLMSLSLVADSLQKRASRESELHNPETVAALCSVSKEIRSLVNTKLEIAKEFAKLEFRKIRMAMQIESHLQSRKD